jgi:hypothetical protein
VFAAIVLGVAGIMRIFDATLALRYRGCSRRISKVRSSGTALRPTAGVYLVVAAELIVCAFLVLSGLQLGRWVGIVADAIGCVSAIWRMPPTQYGP